MSHARSLPTSTDGLVAATAIALLGAGGVFVLAGLQATSDTWVLGGGAAVLLGLGVLVAAGWTDPVVPLLLAAPLPALVDAGTVRLAAVAPVAAVVVAAAALRWGVREEPWRATQLPRWSGSALIVWWLFAALLSPYALTAARESANLLVLTGVLLVALDHFERHPRSSELAGNVLVVVGALCGGFAVMEAVGVIPGEFPRFGTPFNRAALGFGQPNGLGLFMALSTPFAVVRAFEVERTAATWVWRVALLCVLLGLASTFSRGSWFSAVAAIPILFLAGERRRALRLVTGALVAIVFVDLVSGGMVRDTVARTFGDWIIEQRAALMLAGIQMFFDHPIVGVGPGGYQHALETYAAQLPQLVEDLPTPHNAYVQMGAETGLPGFVAYVLLLGGILARAVSAVRAGIRQGIASRLRAERAAVLWSVGVVVWAGMFVWPLSHGAGEAVVIVFAMALATGAARGGSGSP